MLPSYLVAGAGFAKGEELVEEFSGFRGRAACRRPEMNGFDCLAVWDEVVCCFRFWDGFWELSRSLLRLVGTGIPFETRSYFAVAHVVGFRNRLCFLNFTRRTQSSLFTQPKLVQKKKKEEQKNECILQQTI